MALTGMEWEKGLEPRTPQTKKNPNHIIRQGFLETQETKVSSSHFHVQLHVVTQYCSLLQALAILGNPEPQKLTLRVRVRVRVRERVRSLCARERVRRRRAARARAARPICAATRGRINDATT